MKERGEATLLCILILVVLTGVLTLCGLKLQHSYLILQKRTKLFLCVKETKGELNRYLTFMGRTNWALKNITRAQLVMIFIPGLQGHALKAQDLKKALKRIQNASLPLYLAKLYDLKKRGCPVDPRMLITPYQIAGGSYKRLADDSALLRSNEWTYYFFSKPYFVTLKINALRLNAIMPKPAYQVDENAAKLSSLLSSQ